VAADSQLKYCVSSHCPVENPQPFSAFHRNKSEPTGYHKYCKVCRKRQASVYTGHKREYDAQRYATAPEVATQRAKKYYQENPELVKARVRAWQVAHPEWMEERRPVNNAARRTPKGRTQGRKDAHQRRARLAQSLVESFDDLEIFERDGWVCQLCLEPVDPSLAWPDGLSKSLDHIVPLAFGGSHSRENTQLAHLVCNIKKGRREVMPGEFRKSESASLELVTSPAAR
jgi:5-methylcytosine-specific restriction endonuclease McrA